MKKTLLFIALLFAFQSQAQTVSTFAGSYSTNGGYGDNTNPLYSQFKFPYGVAINKNTGEVFIADAFNNCIRKIAVNGEVTTFAGTTTAGFADGIGASARFYNPRAIAIDASGTLYVGDTGNYRVRKITPAGEVTTLAGNSMFGYVNATGDAARFSGIVGLVVDATGNVYVADRDNNSIRKITPSGVVTTLTGSLTSGYADGYDYEARFFSPTGISIDSQGNLFVADTNNQRIRKITFGSPVNIVSTIAGSPGSGNSDGTGSGATFNYPYGITIDSGDNLYVTDQSNHRIRKITSTGVVSTIAGNTLGYVDAVGTNALFRYPAGITIDSNDDLFVTDMSNHVIRKIVMSNLSQNDFELNSKFTVYPNPVKDVLNIQNNEGISFESYSIIDVNGRVLISQSKEIENSSSSINISNLSKGIYFVNFETEKGLVTKKIIKE